ncbi:MAG: hypothetical protein ACRDNY_07150 [Gaiellaceae bacterium]
MWKRLGSVLALALAAGLLALTGGAGAQIGDDPVPPPNQGVVPCWILSGQVVDGVLSFELKPEEELPAVVKVLEAKAHAVWSDKEGVVAFKVDVELVFEVDGGGGFAGFGVQDVLEEGKDSEIREAEWKADGLEARVEISGIVTPTMVGEDEFFALRIELPAVVKQILPF